MSTQYAFLLDVPEQLSPRLEWERDNKLITFHSLPDDEGAMWYAGFYEGDIPESSASWFGEETCQHGGHRVGTGDTEDEAVVALCKKHGVRLWNEGAWCNPSGEELFPI